jgi:hypothetical protein
MIISGSPAGQLHQAAYSFAAANAVSPASILAHRRKGATLRIA